MKIKYGRNVMGSKIKIRDAEYKLREKKREDARQAFLTMHFAEIALKMGLKDVVTND